jgi:hypothetical protein
MKSHLSDAELDALQSSTLHRTTPFLVQGVSHGQLSVARYYGGCAYQGQSYLYIPLTDELVRADVVKWLRQYRTQQKALRQPTQQEMP